jgi:integrase
MQAKLTKRVVDAAAANGGRDIWVWDTELRGFGLRVRPNGHKSYVLEYRPGGGGRGVQKRRFTIGQHGSPWTPDTAREEALRVLGQVAGGADPAAAKVEARRKEGDTLAEVVGVFIEKYAKVRQKSWRETERTFRHDVLPALGSKRPEDVTRRDIVRLIDGVADRGPIMANRTLAYLRKFFNWCIERGHVEANPCAGIKAPGVAVARDRVLEDGELVEIWRAADGVGWPWGAIVKMLALTAQRRTEVVEMRWSEVDLGKGTWTLPGTRTKNKRAHEVPLTGTAVAILQAIPRMTFVDADGKSRESPFVFTTTGRTAVGGLGKAKTAMDGMIAGARRKAAQEAGGDPEEVAAMPHWTLHDLRRTATTGMARLGIHPHVADAVLNHKTGAIQGVAAVYNRFGYLEERRRALEAWEAHVLALLEGREAGGNVVPLRAAGG